MFLIPAVVVVCVLVVVGLFVDSSDLPDPSVGTDTVPAAAALRRSRWSNSRSSVLRRSCLRIRFADIIIRFKVPKKMNSKTVLQIEPA